MTNEESEPQPLDLRGLVDLSDPEALSVQAREFVAQIRRALRLD